MRITPLDDDKVNNGTWTKYLGVPLLIARANNDKFKREFRRLSKPYQREIDKGTISDEVAEGILNTALARTILLGWDASQVPDNIQYSEEAAIQLLAEDSDCRQFVLDFSKEVENYYVNAESYAEGK